MIARIWTARAPAANVAAYRAHVEERVLPGLKTIDGYRGATLLTRSTPDGVQIVVITLWTSLEAVRAFAGADVERAVVAEEVRPLLTTWSDRVKHYDVLLADEPRTLNRTRT